jgi:N-acetylneuraminate synthase
MQTDKPTFIIAEAGVNHNGSVEMALQLIDVAVEAGADAVKFQTFRTEKVISRFAPKAEYQTRTTDAEESQFDMVKKLEFGEETHRLLIEHCSKKGIQFLSTPFDLESVDLLSRTFDLPCLKIPSGEITNALLLLKAAQTGKKIILSTGMSTIGEIETALGVLAFGYCRRGECPSIVSFQDAYISVEGQRLLKEMVTLLHCTTEYPAPFAEVNLRAMDTMVSAFGLPVGFSDHTPGIAISIAAVARGAVIIEKHFTLDSNLPGPDHKASLEPGNLKAMVQAIRQVEPALGSGVKLPVLSEIKNVPIARKSVVAAKAIRKGELFTEGNLAVKRPGNGISPMRYWEMIGKPALRDFDEDEVID